MSPRPQSTTALKNTETNKLEITNPNFFISVTNAPMIVSVQGVKRSEHASCETYPATFIAENRATGVTRSEKWCQVVYRGREGAGSVSFSYVPDMF